MECDLHCESKKDIDVTHCNFNAQLHINRFWKFLAEMLLRNMNLGNMNPEEIVLRFEFHQNRSSGRFWKCMGLKFALSH